jgi:hypothetical protein
MPNGPIGTRSFFSAGIGTKLNQTAGSNLIAAGLGVLRRIVVLVAPSSGGIQAYDIATAGGTKDATTQVFASPTATPAVGTVFDVQMPVANGAVVVVGAGGVVAVSYG